MSKASSKTVRIGLLGAGNRLCGIIRKLHSCDREGKVRVVSAYDPQPVALESLPGNLGYSFERAPSEEALVHQSEVDWVFVGSWNCLHARHAIMALEAGKNVFCEKPMATNLEDCLAIRDAVAASGRVFALGLVLRYSAHYSRIHEIIKGGLLGKILSFEFNETLGFNHGGHIFGNWRRFRRNGGGHLLEKCCHDLDLANWMIGSVPVQVVGFGGRDFFVPENAHRPSEIGLSSGGLPAYGAWPEPDPGWVDPFTSDADIFDNQVAIMQYANGARATFHTNCNAAIPERRMYILGSHGALRADLVGGTIETSTIGWEAKIEHLDTRVRGGHGGGDEVMAASLLRTLTDGESPLASIAEGICSAVPAFGIDQSCSEGRVVNLDSYWEKAGIVPELVMNP